MSEIQSLTLRLEQLNQRVDWWNTAIIVALVFAAIAAIAVVVTTRMALVRTKQLAAVQDELIQAKDEQIKRDLGEKDLRIAGLLKTVEDERLARVEIEEALAWRRFSPEDKTTLQDDLIRFKGQGASIWYKSGDTEGAAFAWDIARALDAAKWDVLAPASVMTMSQAGIPLKSATASLNTGVEVASTHGTQSREAAEALVKALRARGFDANTKPTLENGSGSLVWVNVETRPAGQQGQAKLRLSRQHK